jgi:hypothetical protein
VSVASPEPRPAPRDRVTVPDLVGLTAIIARASVLPDLFVVRDGGGPLRGGSVITAQDPLPGTRVTKGSRVTVWVDQRGPGGTGVREPRNRGPIGGLARGTLMPPWSADHDLVEAPRQPLKLR